MGAAIAGVVTSGGNSVQVLTNDPQKASAAIPTATHAKVGEPITGDIVILALPYGAIAGVLSQYAGELDGKAVVDITNPLNFATFDSLVVPVGTSAAELIAETLPGSSVLKAFNTNFAATLASGTVGAETTTVLIAGNDADAKAALAAVIEAGGLRAVDAGSLKRGPRARSPRLPPTDPRSRRENVLDERLRAGQIGTHDEAQEPSLLRCTN